MLYFKELLLQPMYLAYFYWQFVVAPTWLARLLINLERALLIFFSVPTMVVTLFAHWHRDAVSARHGTISAIAMAYAWNAISRGIGFIIRVTMIVAWVICAIVLLIAGALLIIAFLAWPFVVLFGLAAGIALLQGYAG